MKPTMNILFLAAACLASTVLAADEAWFKERNITDSPKRLPAARHERHWRP
jgi:hypothetical protein